MADLVGQDAGQFRLIVQISEQAPVDVDKTTGGCESVDVGAIEYRESEWELGPVAVGHQALADAIDVILQFLIIVSSTFGHHFLVHLPANGNFFFL